MEEKEKLIGQTLLSYLITYTIYAVLSRWRWSILW